MLHFLAYTFPQAESFTPMSGRTTLGDDKKSAVPFSLAGGVEKKVIIIKDLYFLPLTPTLSLREREAEEHAAQERVNERKKCKLLLVPHEGGPLCPLEAVLKLLR
jgi:hypothetical protein